MKSTLTITPETKLAIDNLPPYIRFNEFLKFYGFAEPGVYSIGTVVKEKERMRYTTWQRSIDLGNLCRNFTALVKEIK